MAKSMLTSDHHTHTRAFPYMEATKLEAQNCMECIFMYQGFPSLELKGPNMFHQCHCTKSEAHKEMVCQG